MNSKLAGLFLPFAGDNFATISLCIGVDLIQHLLYLTLARLMKQNQHKETNNDTLPEIV